MPSEVIRCSECGMPIKGVPAWLATTSVRFSCTNCPRKPSRSAARFEPAVEQRAVLPADSEAEIEAVDIDEIEEDADLDLSLDEIDESKDDQAL